MPGSKRLRRKLVELLTRKDQQQQSCSTVETFALTVPTDVFDQVWALLYKQPAFLPQIYHHDCRSESSNKKSWTQLVDANKGTEDEIETLEIIVANDGCSVEGFGMELQNKLQNNGRQFLRLSNDGAEAIHT